MNNKDQDKPSIRFESESPKEIQAFLDNIIALMPGHVYWKDINGVYIGCNNLQAQSAGFASRIDMIGKTDYAMPWKEQADALRKADLEVMQTGVAQILEEASLLADGTEAIFLSNKVPLYHKERIIGILGISFNITERKNLENNVKASKDQVESILDNIIANLPGHVYWKDIQGTFLGCNDLQANSAGFSSRKEMLGKTDYDMPWKEQADALRAADLDVMETESIQTTEEISLLADGTEAIFLSKKVPLYEKGKISGILGISFDITDQKKTEQELHETKNKLDGMTLVSASIAHELRTPLATISMNAEALKETLPDLIHAYQLAEKAALPVQKTKSDFLNYLKKSPDLIEREARAAFTIIDMLLMNLKAIPKSGTISRFSISQCIQDALSRYPFRVEQEKLIRWQKDEDFIVEGTVELVIHVLFNLIKNALYYIAKASKGEITLWLEKGKDYNSLYFKDTGTGIAKKDLPFIFDRFFSQTRHGAGVGLTFCKMVMELLGGTITCKSVEKKYTQFTLCFPSINKEQDGHETI